MYRNELLWAERALDEIRVRLTFAGAAEIAAHSRVDLCRLAGAVGGVLALHSPATGAGCRICPARRRHRGWPCATVRTVSGALAGGPPVTPTREAP